MRICIVMVFPSQTHVGAFVADPSLVEAMSRAGVTGAPTINIAVTR